MISTIQQLGVTLTKHGFLWLEKGYASSTTKANSSVPAIIYYSDKQQRVVRYSDEQSRDTAIEGILQQLSDNGIPCQLIPNTGLYINGFNILSLTQGLDVENFQSKFTINIEFTQNVDRVLYLPSEKERAEIYLAIEQIIKEASAFGDVDQAYVDQQDQQFYQKAKDYTDEAAEDALAGAKSYTDEKSQEILQEGKSYTNQAIEQIDLSDYYTKDQSDQSYVKKASDQPQTIQSDIVLGEAKSFFGTGNVEAKQNLVKIEITNKGLPEQSIENVLANTDNKTVIQSAERPTIVLPEERQQIAFLSDISQSGSTIDDNTISKTTTYSSEKIEQRLSEQSGSSSPQTLDQVLTEGNTTTKTIVVNSADATTTVGDGIKVLASDLSSSTVDSEGVTVASSETNFGQYQGSKFLLNTANGLLKGSVEEGFLDNSKPVISANPSRQISEQDAAVVRSQLKIIDDQNASTAKTYSSSYVDSKFSEVGSRIDAVEGVGGFLTMHDFQTATPTQQQLTNYALQEIPGISDPKDIFNNTRVENTFDNSVWILANTPDTTPPVFEWIKGSNASVSIATEQSVGVVKGSSESLKVFVQADGTMQVNGLSGALGEKLTANNLIAGTNVTLAKNGNDITISALGGGSSGSGSSADLSNYYTKTESDSRFGSKAAEHTHANKTSILDLFTVDGGTLKWNGNPIPINPQQIEQSISGAKEGLIFDIAAICNENQIKALINGYLFIHNTLTATEGLPEDQQDPNTAEIKIYNGNVLVDTIAIAPSESRTYQLPNLKTFKVEGYGTIDGTLSIVGYIY